QRPKPAPRSLSLRVESNTWSASPRRSSHKFTSGSIALSIKSRHQKLRHLPPPRNQERRSPASGHSAGAGTPLIHPRSLTPRGFPARSELLHLIDFGVERITRQTLVARWTACQGNEGTAVGETRTRRRPRGAKFQNRTLVRRHRHHKGTISIWTRF